MFAVDEKNNRKKHTKNQKLSLTTSNIYVLTKRGQVITIKNLLTSIDTNTHSYNIKNIYIYLILTSSDYISEELLFYSYSVILFIIQQLHNK